jgi:hypothetical protein
MKPKKPLEIKSLIKNRSLSEALSKPLFSQNFKCASKVQPVNNIQVKKKKTFFRKQKKLENDFVLQY